MPASIRCNHLVCLWWTPGIGCVLKDRSDVSQDGIYYLPFCLDGVLAYKERFLTFHGRCEEPLIWRHLVGCLVDCDKLNIFTPHGLSWNFGLGTNRDLDEGTDTEAVIIKLRRLNLPKYGLGWTFQRNLYFRGSQRQALASPDEERHVGPTPGVDREFHRSKRLDLRIGSDAIFLAVALVLAPHNIRRIKWPH